MCCRVLGGFGICLLGGVALVVVVVVGEEMGSLLGLRLVGLRSRLRRLWRIGRTRVIGVND